MTYGKYFAKGQKVFLKRLFDEEDQEALDTITAYAMGGGEDYLDLFLPYGSDAADAYPFAEGMRFELLTDFNGMGLRLTTSFREKTSARDIRLTFGENLEFISRRLYRRVDVNAWVGPERPASGLEEMRAAWRDALKQLESGVSAADMTEFRKFPVNLAGGGLRLPLPTARKPADLMLLYLSIGDKQGIICALVEVVWAGRPDEQGEFQTGLRFVNILERDQARIDAVVLGLLEKLQDL